MITKLFADRLSEYGILVNEIRPGIIATDMTQKVKDKYIVKGFDFEREFSIDFLKQVFKPCDGYSWEMLNEKKSQTDINAVKKNKTNKN